MAKTLLLLAVILVWTVTSQGVQTPGVPEVQTPPRNLIFRTLDLPSAYELIENQVTQSEETSRAITTPVAVDTYTLATTVFNLNRYFNYCDQCRRLEYLAFRVGRYYLTARSGFLRLEVSSSPNNNQLFIAEQQVDGTWAFRSLALNRYIRASNNGVTINYQTFVGAWERWYMERHGAHVHIQSAQFAYHWWAFNGLTLEQYNGGASALIVEYWPKLQWLWNW